MTVLGVDELQSILANAFPELDVPHVEEVTDESVIVSYAVTDRHGRPGGTLSGPVMMSGRYGGLGRDHVPDRSGRSGGHDESAHRLLAQTATDRSDGEDAHVETRPSLSGRRRRPVLAWPERTGREVAGHVLHPSVAQELILTR